MFNYIKFDLFLKNYQVSEGGPGLSNSGEATTGKGDIKSNILNTLNKISGDLRDLNIQNKLQDFSASIEGDKVDSEKLNELLESLKKLDSTIAGLKIVGKSCSILNSRLESEGDPKDEDCKKTLSTLNFLKSRFNSLLGEKAELSKILSDAIDGITGDKKTELSKEDTNKFKTITSKEFLNISPESRLQYITKGHYNSSEIINGNIKNLEFTFTYDGSYNEELYRYTTAGQVLPNQVRNLVCEGVSYERIGLNGEFYSNSNQRLIIREGTKIEIGKIPENINEQLLALEKEIQEKYDKFIKTNPKYAENQYKDVIKESFSKGLGEEDLMFILTFSYDKLQNLDKTRAAKLLVVSEYLDNSGFLDDFSYAGEMIKKLEEIVNVLEVYGNNLKYKIEGGNVKFQFDNNGLPEGLNVEPSMQKFIQVGLSQLGVNEHDGGADKYFKEIGFGNLNSRNTPWCGAFINWALRMSGFKGTNSLAAKSFIESEGFGHVGIKLGNKLLGGNQGDKVSLVNITRPVAGYAIPSEKGLEVHKPAGDFSKIPDGAILVFDRNTSDSRFR